MRELLTPKEVGQILRLSTGQLCNWRQTGHGPAFIQEGRIVRYDSQAIEDWIEMKLAQTQKTYPIEIEGKVNLNVY